MLVERQWVHDLPKAEVHVHLEGCIDADELERLARSHGVPMPRPVESLFDFDGLSPFLEFLDWAGSLIRTGEDAARVARRFALRQARAGVRYTDVIINPTHWPAWKRDLTGLVDALDAGWTEAEQDGLPRTGLCVSLLRQQSASAAAELVDWLVETRHPRVVGLSIDGDESRAGRVSARFADAFDRAARWGIPRTVHAGESSGPEGVRDALNLLKANRIDHGFRAVEEPGLLAELAERQVPLGICPGSNVSLGFVSHRADHPVRLLRDAGVIFSLNTDDGTALGSDLITEYAATAEVFGWTHRDLIEVARASLTSAFCDDDTRAALVAELDAIRAGQEERP